MMPSTDIYTNEDDAYSPSQKNSPTAILQLCRSNQIANAASRSLIATTTTNFKLPIKKTLRSARKKSSKARPPSGYNIFFHMVRESILQQNQDKSRVPFPFKEDGCSEFTPCRIAKAAISLRDKPKRKHVKVHNSSLSFHELTRTVAESWKNLIPSKRAMFTTQADVEFEHHHQMGWKLKDTEEKTGPYQTGTFPRTSNETNVTQTQQITTHHPNKYQELERLQKEYRCESDHWYRYHSTVSYGHIGREWNTNNGYSDSYYLSPKSLAMTEKVEWKKPRMYQANNFFYERDHYLRKSEHEGEWNGLFDFHHTGLPKLIDQPCNEDRCIFGSYRFNPIEEGVDLFCHQADVVLRSKQKGWGFPDHSEKPSSRFRRKKT